MSRLVLGVVLLLGCEFESKQIVEIDRLRIKLTNNSGESIFVDGFSPDFLIEDEGQTYQPYAGFTDVLCSECGDELQACTHSDQERMVSELAEGKSWTYDWDGRYLKPNQQDHCACNNGDWNRPCLSAVGRIEIGSLTLVVKYGRSFDTSGWKQYGDTWHDTKGGYGLGGPTPFPAKTFAVEYTGQSEIELVID